MDATNYNRAITIGVEGRQYQEGGVLDGAVNRVRSDLLCIVREINPAIMVSLYYLHPLWCLQQNGVIYPLKFIIEISDAYTFLLLIRVILTRL